MLNLCYDKKVDSVEEIIEVYLKNESKRIFVDHDDRNLIVSHEGDFGVSAFSLKNVNKARITGEMSVLKSNVRGMGEILIDGQVGYVDDYQHDNGTEVDHSDVLTLIRSYNLTGKYRPSLWNSTLSVDLGIDRLLVDNHEKMWFDKSFFNYVVKEVGDKHHFFGYMAAEEMVDSSRKINCFVVLSGQKVGYDFHDLIELGSILSYSGFRPNKISGLEVYLDLKIVDDFWGFVDAFAHARMDRSFPN